MIQKQCNSLLTYSRQHGIMHSVLDIILPVSYTHLDVYKRQLSKHTNKAQNKFDLPGVYKLNCSDCNKFYICQTGHCFKHRYIEHTMALHSTTESTFANHVIEANHTSTNIDNNMNILHVHTKGRKLDT